MSQFLIPGFRKPLRIGMKRRRGGILVNVKSSLSSKLFTTFKLLGAVLKSALEKMAVFNHRHKISSSISLVF